MRRPRSGSGPLVTYRLVVEYDGSGFSGWQVQANARTVVGELDRALRGAGATPIDLGGSGRTDAGVHALAQVAHLRFERSIDPVRLREEVNERLPNGIQVLALDPAPPRFHARHDAVARAYLYQICRRRTAFAKRWVWWPKAVLDVETMRAAAELVEGRHDFARFSQADAAVESTLVEVERVEVVPAGDLVLVRVLASHFLWRMVRRLVGALVQAGAGTLSLSDLQALLEGGTVPGKDPATWTAPAAGLFLERVLYPGDPPLGPIAPVTPVLPSPAMAPPPAGKPAARRPGKAARRRSPGGSRRGR